MATVTEAVGTAEVELADPAGRSHLLVAIVFLVVGAAAGLVLALKLTFVDFLGGSAPLAYGRLLPAYTGAVLFGWLTLAQLGTIYYLLPRLTGAPLWNRRLADATLVLVGGGTVAGLAGVLAGQNQGRALLEFAWWADLSIVAGLVGAAVVVTRSVARRAEPVLYLSLWFFLAGVWWMALSYALGALPGVTGVDLAILSRAAGSGVLLLWVLPVGIGVGYYLVPKLTGNALYSHRLGVISFWSLALTLPWVGAHQLSYGPAPASLQTIAAMFAIGLVVPITAVLANWGLTSSGSWDLLRRSGPLRFLAAGSAFLVVLPVQLAGLALRAPSAVTQFTPWTEAGFVIAAWGIGTLWAMAVYEHARPGPAGWVTQLRSTAAGVALLVAVLWLGGLMAGFTWSSAPVSREFSNFGEGWVNTSGPLASFDAVRWVAWVLIAAGQALFAYRMLRGRWASASVPVLEDVAEPGAADG